ncbi:hypothetical protein [Arenicella xantha]|uniref:DUF802 domain-containing protein n=1 Tax=Arenicella xantha TaxID=644221 RepID=A0A395JJ67_9GAMM|nr:hypothetical protein [Arenicella xantha]RBP50731.1 hypothetical protein DFR28_102142 [Arenicella xantha]
MTRILFGTAFCLGALAIIWMGGIFLGSDTLGFGVTLVIGAVYAIGAWELVQFRRATNTLKLTLSDVNHPVTDLVQWLAPVHPSLQNAVRRRIEGANNGLPAPVVTPYLVGLLVMLGLLGTFLGMVGTLKGAVVALEGSSELEAIRAGLAAPIEGLGLAFGTSVAGVAASAMLGLLSTLSRRERLQASQSLDTKIGLELRQFSGHYTQQLAFQAIQDQAQSLPAVAEQLSALANNLEQMGERIGERLLANQESFQGTVTELYGELNERVDRALKTSLVESAELISSSVMPMAENTLAQLNKSALETQQTLTSNSERQMKSLNDALSASNAEIQTVFKANLAQHSKTSDSLVEAVNSAMASASQNLQSTSQSLIESFSDTSAQWAERQREQAEQLSSTISVELQRVREEEGTRGNMAVERLGELESVVAGHLATLGQALEEPMQRLIETASQTPKAAAQVIEKLRGEMTKNLERDNDLLSERTRLMEQLDSLSKTLEQSAVGQREAVDALIERSADTLSQVGEQFGERMQGESTKLAAVAEHFASSSAEIASLGDAFNAAVTLFSESNSQLIENLTRIETSLEQSTSRSDEQLKYYVAQAREIIDHNVLSHQKIIDAVQAQPTQAAVKKAS